MSSPQAPLDEELQHFEHELAVLPASAEDLAAARRAQRLAGAAIVLVVLLLVALWALTPARHWMSPARLASVGEALAYSPLAWPAILLAFIVGGLVAFPVNLLSAATVLVLGPWQGALCALVGASVSGAVLYEIGARLAGARLRALAGPRLMQVAERVKRRGLLAVIFVRVVPLAPFSLVCLVAGAVAIRRRDYWLGTLLGLAPGIGLAALFVDRALAALRHPDAATFAVLGGVIVLIAAAAWWTHRQLRRSLADA